MFKSRLKGGREMEMKTEICDGVDRKSLVSRPYRWADLTWEEIAAWIHLDPVVVIPVGSIEQHGRHLPVKTDTAIATYVADKAVEKVRESSSVLLAPTISIGCSEHHIEFPGTLALNEEAFIQVGVQIGMSIVYHGFRRLLFLNAHGGNEAPLNIVKSVIRRRTEGHVLCVAVSSRKLVNEEAVRAIRHSKPGGMSHAGEFETSALMALDEPNVHPERITKFLPEWTNGYFQPGAYVNSRVSLGFHLKDFTESGVVGDPTEATADRGLQFLELRIDALGAFIKAFSQWEYDNLYNQPECE